MNNTDIPEKQKTGYIIGSLQSLWRVFLIVSIPTHIWSIMLAFGDVQTITERTNMFDAVGFVAYMLLFALAETVLVFLVILIADFLLPRQWTRMQHVLTLGLLSFTVAFWTMLWQLNYWAFSRRGLLYNFVFIENAAHPLRWGGAILLIIVVLVLATVAAPILLVARSPKFVNTVTGIFNRLATLATFYMLVDVIGVLIIIYRNLAA